MNNVEWHKVRRFLDSEIDHFEAQRIAFESNGMDGDLSAGIRFGLLKVKVRFFLTDDEKAEGARVRAEMGF